MTFVIARRFDARIVLLADTKISDPNATGRFDPEAGVSRDRSIYANNYVPGRLKAFPLSLRLSIGYAGRSNAALEVIRSIADTLDTMNDLAGVLAALREASAAGEIEFLVASHIAGPQIFKIWDGRVSGDQSTHWIGDGAISPVLTAAIARTESRLEALHGAAPSHASSEEACFVSGWSDLLLRSPALRGEVGGIPISLLASPYGHCFNASAGVYSPDAVHYGDGRTENADGEPVEASYGQYGFTLLPGDRRGAAVLGLWLDQTGLGYMYDPLANNEAICLSGSSREALGRAISKRASALGGILESEI